MRTPLKLLLPCLCLASGSGLLAEAVNLTGELRQWHKVTLTITGPAARETDTAPNPFADYRMLVTFTHNSGQPSYTVPGYFAADGHAAESSATSGDQWRAHLAPDKQGVWTYTVSFVRGLNAAIDPAAAVTTVTGCDGLHGEFTIGPSDKGGRDFRAIGRLEYAGVRYLRFAGSGGYFLKAGADAPETLLAYADFDDTVALRPKVPLKTWSPHVRDWTAGDPTWQGGKGKGLIGAINYLSGKGANSMSFLTYNAGGDGDNVWPFVSRDDKFHYDCSKLDQWQIVFDHAQHRGLHLHFKLQETENDDNIVGHNKPGKVPESLDGGDLGPERRLYLREIVARFGYELALNWNLGEENTQTTAQQLAMGHFLRATDPYPHPIVIHTYPELQEKIYPPLLGPDSPLTGASLQNPWDSVHQRVLRWVRASAASGKPWVVANDEQNDADTGVPPDPGYEGHDGIAVHKERRDGSEQRYTLHDIRKLTLWGSLLAGGAGVEYYFGYKLPQNDLLCEDWRSRDRSWDYARFALDFFQSEAVPFPEMENADELVGNAAHDNSRYCFAKLKSLYLVYLPNGGTATLDLTGTTGPFSIEWFNPRAGGLLQTGSVPVVPGGTTVSLGEPPADQKEDWLAVIRAQPALAWAPGQKVLIVGGGKFHDFERWFHQADAKTLTDAGFSVNYTEDAALAAHVLPQVDVLVLAAGAGWTPTPGFRQAVNQHLAAGRGFVALHTGVWRNWPDWPELETHWLGLGANSHPKTCEFEISVLQPDHAVLRGVPAIFRLTDELYQTGARDGSVPVTVLAQTSASPGDGRTHPSVWIPAREHGRTVCIALGHDGRARTTTVFPKILTNAVTWVASP